jgi:hypothetical protein
MNWYKISQSEEKKASYSAVVLDEASHMALLDSMKEHIPEGWKEYAHHMTINLGPLKGDRGEIGKTVTITASSWDINDKAIAVAVDGYERKMPGTAHVTVAVNSSSGGKPKDSNDLSNWKPLEKPISLNGTVLEVFA